MLAISDEPLDKVEPYNEQYGFPFPVAAGSKTADELGTLVGSQTLPHTFLVDAEGRIAWHGHPSQLTSNRIKAALKGVARPGDNAVIAWHGSVEGAPEKALERAGQGELAEALKITESDGGAGAQALKSKLEAHVASVTAQVEAAVERKHFARAMGALTVLAEDLEDHALGTEPNRLLARLQGDESVQRELEAHEALQKALDVGNRRGMDKAAKKLEAIVEDYAGTQAAERARILLKDV